MEKKRSFTARTWAVIWIIGIAGQLCWNVENQLFNTFVYKKIAPEPDIVSLMVAISAVVTTVSTFIMGTVSDRRGKRKPFVAFGYIIWGVTTILFGVTEFMPKEPLIVAVMAVIGADAVMSFFGSMGNDSGYSAWTTDISTERNRGQLGAAVAAQPVIATVIGTIGCAALIDIFDYFIFFVIFGIFVSLTGVFALFFMKESPSLAPTRQGGFFKQFFAIFNFKKLFKNRELMLVIAAVALFFVSFNMYFPYMLIYFEYTLGFPLTIAGILLAVPLLVSVFVAFSLSKFINYGKIPFVFAFAVISNIAGLLVLQIPGTITLIAGILLVGIGYITIFQCMTAWMKNLYPIENKGQFEGLRIIASVLIPMIIGPTVGAAIINTFGVDKIISYDYGDVAGKSPTAILFLFAAVANLLTFIPLIFAGKHYFKQRKAVRASGSTVQTLMQQGELLHASGEMAVAGYALSGNTIKYNRNKVKTKLRLKEWDYYHVQNDKYCLQMIIGHVSYIGAVSVNFFSFDGTQKYLAEALLLMPMDSLKMPRSAAEGITTYRNKHLEVTFSVNNGIRRLIARSLSSKYDFEADITLSGGDSIALATPFYEKNEFYYNQKVSCLMPEGNIRINGETHSFSGSQSYGLLDWGRGVWPFKNEWYWGSASKLDAAVPYGINIGWGFGDTGSATENIIFYDGRAHKINNVQIDKFDPSAKEWHFTSDDGRLELTFELMHNRIVRQKKLWINNRIDQVFGRFSGRLTLNNGEEIAVKDLYGFFEHARNRW